jgi:sugar (pentulose or hexulose) kinase
LFHREKEKKMKILSVDIGTTGMKMGVFEESGDALNLLNQISQEYAINTYNDGLFSDIEQEKWQNAFVSGCRAMADRMAEVDVISLSGTTRWMSSPSREPPLD